VSRASGPTPAATADPRWAGCIRDASPALRFVLLVEVMSFFADFIYEGSRSVIGLLVGVSLGAATSFAVVAQLAAIPLLVAVRRRTRAGGGPG
jgi:hypothetical protein